MNRTNIVAAAALGLLVFACDRHANNNSKPGETNTTSAAQPAENATSNTAAPSIQDKSGAGSDVTNLGANDFAKDAGSATGDTTAFAKDAGRGATSDTAAAMKDAGSRAPGAAQQGSGKGVMGAGTTGTGVTGADHGGVAPGHITTPAGGGRATGEPTSAGSHNMGSGAGAGGR